MRAGKRVMSCASGEAGDEWCAAVVCSSTAGDGDGGVSGCCAHRVPCSPFQSLSGAGSGAEAGDPYRRSCPPTDRCSRCRHYFDA